MGEGLSNMLLELRELVDRAEEDAIAFDTKHNKAAGTRVRKAMLAIKNQAQQIRVRVQEIKNE